MRRLVFPGITLLALSLFYLTHPHKALLLRSLWPGYWILKIQGKDLFDAELGILRHGSYHLPKVALTFDDGPRPGITDRILKLLRQEGVRATFFIVGIRAKEAPDLIRAILKEGHELGNHTYDHQRLTALKDHNIRNEIRDTEVIIQRIWPGYRLRFFRPPGGQEQRRVFEIARSLGYITVLWSATAGDYDNLSPSQIVSDLLDATDNGAILLLHESHPSTVEALPELIQSLRQRGYQLVPLSELYSDLTTRKVSP